MEPGNIELPFFAYGLFKPGQLAYFRIKELVSDIPINASVNGYLKERDGVPLLGVMSDYSKIHGRLIKFKSGKEHEAYVRIADLEPFDIYRWEVVTLSDGTKANTLLGRKMDRGTVDYEGSDWDGKNDPYFSDALNEIEKILKENEEFQWDYKRLFRIQMAYALLWTVIERYAGLRYNLTNENVFNKIKQLAYEPSFSKSLNKRVTPQKNLRTIFSATNPEIKCILDSNNPEKSIKYYYQIRSNSVHRGKCVYHDFDIVHDSLKELLAIFQDVLIDAWSE